MSAYADGHLTFDLQVMDYGTTTGDLQVNIHCEHPCQSGDISVGRPAVGEWETISIPVADLVTGGLDLTRVFTGFQIYPTIGDQEGVILRVDNIFWEAEQSAFAP